MKLRAKPSRRAKCSKASHKRPTGGNTVKLHVQNKGCDHDATVDLDTCEKTYYDLEKYCGWSFDSHKGGWHDTECFQYWFDVN